MVQRSPDLLDIAAEGLEQALEAERRIEPVSNVRKTWEAIFKDARVCTRCDLYKHATQTVFGEGPLDASIVFVGEQPGIRRISPDGRSSGPRARSSMARWRRRGSTVRRCTSPMP